MQFIEETEDHLESCQHPHANVSPLQRRTLSQLSMKKKTENPQFYHP